MKTAIKLLLVSVLMLAAAPAWSDSFSHFLKCEQDDDATNEDLYALASKWLAAAKTMNGGDKIEVSLQFPVVAQMDEGDFVVVITSPSLSAWGAFMDGYEGSPAQALDKEWDELAACPDSAMFKSVQVK